MTELTREQYEERLQKKEQELTAQLDRLYSLAKSKAEMDVLKLEFQRIVERVTEKYFLLFSLLETDKVSYTQDEYEERSEVLRAKYKEDLALIAVAIDAARGVEQT